MKNKKELRLVKTECRETMLIFGRNTNGEPDRCFEVGKEYLFCYDEKKDEIFTVNDVKEIHFLKLNDKFTQEHFEIKEFLNLNDCDLDEVTKQRYVKLFKERYEYSVD